MTTMTNTCCAAENTRNPASVLTLVQMGIAARRQRRALSHLDDAALKDIGLSRSEALSEAKRPFWDIPAHQVR